MARPLRIVYDGAVYHVTLRGNERKAIFRDDQDRWRYLFQLEESLKRYDVRLYLFCLMANHVHMVLETPRGNLSRFMQRFETAYALYFNRRHNRHGHLWQGRFGAAVVDEDEYILKLSRYVHLNPVFTAKSRVLPMRERIDILRSFPWSSYRGYIGKTQPMTFVEEGPVLAMMGRSVRSQRFTYRRFVEAAIIDIDAAFFEAKKQSPLCIGSETCLERVRSLYEALIEDASSPQDICFRRPGTYCEVEDVLSAVCEAFGVERTVLFQRRRDSVIRPMAAQMLCEYSGLNQREVAHTLKLQTGAAVSHQIKRLGDFMAKNASFRREYARIVRVIQQKHSANTILMSDP